MGIRLLGSDRADGYQFGFMTTVHVDAAALAPA
jgi:hypothetical protein